MEDVPGIDLSKKPGAATAASLAVLGPAAAADRIEAALRDAYRPPRGSIPGSAANPSFGQWLRLARWFRMLAETDTAAFARFLQPYFQVLDRGEKMALGYRLPDTGFTSAGEPPPAEMLEEFIGSGDSRQKMLEVFIPADFRWQGGRLEEYLGEELAAKLAGDQAFLEEFLLTVSPQDFLPAVFQNLRRLHAHDPATFEKYPQLAIALAVVFDQLPPAAWPHHQVDPTSIPAPDQSLEDRFSFWVDSQKNKKLLADIGGMGADQLKFVVDAPVAASELEWAQREVRLPRQGFGKAFGSVRYDAGRLSGREFSWPRGEPYTLEAIRKRGGICVDQAYFAMLAGKARGIPTLFFVGQGADGGHAWFGYLRQADKWDLDAGRYENQNYAVGEALDPQSWERITDHELKFLAARIRKQPAYRAGENELHMAEIFRAAGDRENAASAVDAALAASPQNPLAWEEKTRLLREGGAAPGQIMSHLENAAKSFAADPDLRSFYLAAQAELARETGDHKKADAIEKGIVSRNQKGRTDLSVGVASQRLGALLEAGDKAGALQEFRSQLARLGKSGGGDFFYEVVKPLAEFLAASGSANDARRVVDSAKRAMRPARESILEQEFRDLEEALSRRNQR